MCEDQAQIGHLAWVFQTFKIWIDGSPMITMDNCLRETHSAVIHLSIFEMQPWRRLERKQHCLQDCICWVWNTLGGSNNSLHSKTAKGRSRESQSILHVANYLRTCRGPNFCSSKISNKKLMVTWNASESDSKTAMASLGLLEKEGKGFSMIFIEPRGSCSPPSCAEAPVV